MNPAFQAILRRRSIRKYTDQPVEPQVIELLLKAGMAAPSAMNCKPWEFVVVTEADRLAQFRSRLVFGNRN
ncbi:MAG TPA: nitroreductase family protein, partial [Anaerolineales bacterium]|nr:nitroreductase family protein [Anaerolineales bacterium]